MAITPQRTYATGANGNTNAPSITIPAGLPSGAFGVLAFSQNNSDVVTATPTGLTQVDATTNGSANFPVKLYTYKIGDGTNGTITAGTVLSWSLSAVRSWTLAHYPVTGQDATTPMPLLVQAGSVATSTTVSIPSSGTTTQSLWLAEIVVGKANGTAITTWTAPAGWTNRILVASNGTFGGSSVIADRDAGVAAPGTYGGETYTSDAASAVASRFIVGFKPANTTAVPAGWDEVRLFTLT